MRVVQLNPVVSAIDIAVHFQPIVILQQRLLASRALQVWLSSLTPAAPIAATVKHSVASHSLRSSGLCIFIDWTMLKSKAEFYRLWCSLHSPGHYATGDAKRSMQDAYAMRLAVQQASPHTAWCRVFLTAHVPSLLPKHYRVADMMQFLSAMTDSWHASMISSWYHRVQLSKAPAVAQASLSPSTQLPRSAFIAMANLAAGAPAVGSSPLSMQHCCGQSSDPYHCSVWPQLNASNSAWYC